MPMGTGIDYQHLHLFHATYSHVDLTSFSQKTFCESITLHESSFMKASGCETRERYKPGKPRWFEVKFRLHDQPQLGQH